MCKKEVINSYYANNGSKLRGIVDKVAAKFGITYDRDEYYSIANEVFAHVIVSYDESRDFETLIYHAIENKIKTELTRQNRQRRIPKKAYVSIEMPISNESELTYEDTIPSNFDIFLEAFGDEFYSPAMERYLAHLSKRQKSVLIMISNGYSQNEICQTMEITSKQYGDCISAIHSFHNIQFLSK